MILNKGMSCDIVIYIQSEYGDGRGGMMFVHSRQEACMSSRQSIYIKNTYVLTCVMGNDLQMI